MYCSTLLRQQPPWEFTSLGVRVWLNFRMYLLVWIRFSSFLMEILLIFVIPCFARGDSIDSSLANANSLLLIIPLEVLRFFFVDWLCISSYDSFFFNVFCLSPTVHLDKQVVILCFLTIFWLTLAEFTFSMRKSEHLTWHTTSKDSITMNLGKSAVSFSESHSERFRFIFFIFEDAIYAEYCLLALHCTANSNLFWGCTKWVTHSPWLRWGYVTSILELRAGFRAVEVSGSQLWSNSYSLNAIDPQPPPSST